MLALYFGQRILHRHHRGTERAIRSGSKGRCWRERPVVDDVSVFSSTLINNKESNNIYGASEHCPRIVTQNNTTTLTPKNAYSSVNIVPQLDQTRAELRTALNYSVVASSYMAALCSKVPGSMWDWRQRRLYPGDWLVAMSDFKHEDLQGEILHRSIR